MTFHPTEIIVHHSLTQDSGTVSWGAIRKYHMETMGWSDIGYHAGIELVSSGGEDNFEVLLGRRWDIPGAHTVGYNNTSLGLCFVGNFDVVEPPEEALLLGKKVIELWMKLFGISSSNIHPHSAFSDKSCPGLLFNFGEFIGDY